MHINMLVTVDTPHSHSGNFLNQTYMYRIHTGILYSKIKFQVHVSDKYDMINILKIMITCNSFLTVHNLNYFFITVDYQIL